MSEDFQSSPCESLGEDRRIVAFMSAPYFFMFRLSRVFLFTGAFNIVATSCVAFSLCAPRASHIAS